MSNHKQSSFDYDTLGAIIGVIVFIGIPIVMFLWYQNSGDNSTTNSSETQEYSDWKAEQRANENAEKEACIERMERDVERYGERVIDTYDC